jgi:hypothetical protein
MLVIGRVGPQVKVKPWNDSLLPNILVPGARLLDAAARGQVR